MNLDTLVPVAVVGAVLLAVLAGRRLNRTAQPLRMELAAHGGKLLQRRDITPEMRTQVNHMMVSAFGSLPMLLLMVICVPLLSIVIVFSRKLRAEISKPDDFPTTVVRDQFARVRDLHVTLMACNNPLLMTLVSLEVALLAAPAMLLGNLLFGDPPRTVNRESLVKAIERRATMYGYVAAI